MILYGMYDSPFVRRVAVTMRLYGFDYEHRPWSVGRDQHALREINPVGRVPALVLDSGETLIESAAILRTSFQLSQPERSAEPGRKARAALWGAGEGAECRNRKADREPDRSLASRIRQPHRRSPDGARAAERGGEGQAARA